MQSTVTHTLHTPLVRCRALSKIRKFQMDNWEWDTIHHNCAMGLGMGACSHCGVVQAFDASRFFDFRFYCLAPACNLAGQAYWRACEEERRASLEAERLSLQRWKEQDEARRKRHQELDAVLEAQFHEAEIREAERRAHKDVCFPTIACTICGQHTDRVRLHNNNLLCGACAGEK